MKETWFCQRCHRLRCSCLEQPVGLFRLCLRYIHRLNPLGFWQMNRRMAKNKLPHLRTTQADLYLRKASGHYQRSTQPPLPASPAWEQKE